MSLIRELFRRHRPEAVKSKKGEITFEPLKGKTKEESEKICVEYLQDPTRTSIPDFINFTHKMILLIGGIQRKGSEKIYMNSNPFLDQETNTSIVLRTKKANDLSLMIAEVQAASKDKTESLEVTYALSLVKDPDKCAMHVRFNNVPEQFDSYITGKKEGITQDIVRNNLGPEEVKDFARRIFKVYQNQPRQPKP